MRTEELFDYLIEDDKTVVEALRKIDNNAKGILFVVDSSLKLQGVVTDGDIRRWLIQTGDLQGIVSQFMNTNPMTIYRRDIKFAQEYMRKQFIRALPIVNTKGIVSDIIWLDEEYIQKEESKRLHDIPVVIMAGGKGTRLYPYTKILPKPLIPIGEVPIMERILDRFFSFGITSFYATVNYRKNMIKSYFFDKDLPYQINYVEEDSPLGTAGSIKLIDNEFECPFFVTNCDILINADYSDIYKYHLESGNEITIVSALKNLVIPYGVIHSSVNGAIEYMEEKPRLSHFVNTGMYVLNPEVIQDIPDEVAFHMTDLAGKLLSEGRKVGMYPISEDSFLDMGEFEEMHRMEQKIGLKSE